MTRPVKNRHVLVAINVCYHNGMFLDPCPVQLPKDEKERHGVHANACSSEDFAPKSPQAGRRTPVIFVAQFFLLRPPPLIGGEKGEGSVALSTCHLSEINHLIFCSFFFSLLQSLARVSLFLPGMALMHVS